ncbi:MAG: PilN domain-containing protein [Deltaproteobacteria bacterium]|nr:PilN domain-containing protein [Deltaproteobacteria bacterium]
MNHINFLEKKAFDWRHFELNYFWIMILLGGMLVLFGFYSLAQRHRLLTLQREAVVLQQKETTAGTSAIIQTPAAVLQGRMKWAELLHEIGAKIPASVQLTSITGSIPENRLLRLEGIASNMTALSRLQTELGKVKSLGRINLVSSETEEATAGSPKIKFKMEGKLP